MQSGSYGSTPGCVMLLVTISTLLPSFVSPRCSICPYTAVFTRKVCSAGFSPDDKIVTTASKDCFARNWAADGRSLLLMPWLRWLRWMLRPT